MNLPNLITIGRLLTVPVAIYLLVQQAYSAALVLFVLAAFSDALDGYLARLRNQTTQIGALLDPLADKLLLIGVFVVLGLQQILPIWLVILVVFRDVMIVGGFVLLFLVRLHFKVRPLIVSKVNTATQIVLAAFVIAEQAAGFELLWAEAGMIYLVAATTVISGGGYIVSWTRQIAGMEMGDR